MVKLRTKELFAFIKERHAIYLRRQAGETKPWTKDPILQKYRFCNVYRNLDSVTQWIHANWLRPHAQDPDVWFAMCVARLINLPASLEAISWPVPWRPDKVIRILEQRQSIPGNRIFNSAYKVIGGMHSLGKMGTLEYVVRHVLTPLWKDRKSINARIFGTRFNGKVELGYAHAVLREYRGMGSFMAAQAIADLKEIEPLKSAADWHTWAASGPGSRRGLNWVCGREFDAHWQEQEWHENLLQLKEKVDPFVASLNYSLLHAQDLQNCLCETGKMVKVLQEWGRPKRKFQGV